MQGFLVREIWRSSFHPGSAEFISFARMKRRAKTIKEKAQWKKEPRP